MNHEYWDWDWGWVSSDSDDDYDASTFDPTDLGHSREIPYDHNAMQRLLMPASRITVAVCLHRQWLCFMFTNHSISKA